MEIIDRNPRKPRVEGRKAQERYIEQLHDEWIDNHASKEVFEEAPPEVPENVRRRYAESEAITRQIMEERGMFSAPSGPIVVGEPEVDETRTLAVRGDLLMRKAAWELQAFGAVREDTVAEIEEVAAKLGIAPEDIIARD